MFKLIEALGRLATLAEKEKEKEILAGKATKKTTTEPDWKLTTQCNCPWDRPCVCPDRA